MEETKLVDNLAMVQTYKTTADLEAGKSKDLVTTSALVQETDDLLTQCFVTRTTNCFERLMAGQAESVRATPLYSVSSPPYKLSTD